MAAAASGIASIAAPTDPIHDGGQGGIVRHAAAEAPSDTGAHAYELQPGDQVPADALREAEGGQVVYLTRGGQRVAAIVPADQAWFWTDKWQAGEREADRDLAEGRVIRFDSDEEFLAFIAGSDRFVRCRPGPQLHGFAGS